MKGVRYMAVDWSGNARKSVQRKAIRLAMAEEGRLVRLEGGRTRDEMIDLLVGEIKSGGSTFIGFDFAFSFPQWYLQERQLDSVENLWKLAAQEQEEWLNGRTWPFWGRPGPYEHRPGDLGENRRFRQTDEDHENGNPKSVFQVYGGGAVGTGTIRGLPALARLQDAGAAIWPFDDSQPGGATVIEIYPRLFYGRAVKTSNSVAGRNSRRVYLEAEYAHVDLHWRDDMIESGDAFDAGVSAMVMSANGRNLRDLRRATDQRTLLEGKIWSP